MFRTVIAEAQEQVRAATSTCARCGRGKPAGEPLNSLELEVDLSGPVPAGLLPAQREALAGSRMSSITVRHDLRGRFGPARDQGGRETCLAFAMSDAHAAAIGQAVVAAVLRVPVLPRQAA